MAGVREIMVYTLSAMVGFIFLKLAAPTIQKLPIVGEPVANLIAFV